MHDSGIQVSQVQSPFTADGVTYPVGTWLLPAAQPYRSHLKDLMERQVYPNRLRPDGTAEAPYDVAGWTLPLQMGVPTAAINSAYSGDFLRLDAIKSPPGRVTRESDPDFYTLADTANDDFHAVNALLAAGVEVRRLPDRAASAQHGLDPGTWLVMSKAIPDAILAKGSSVFEGRIGLSVPLPPPIHAARLGLYQPWEASMDEGWTRLVLEQFEFPYTTLHDAEIKAGHLAERFDAMILPSVTAKVIREGQRPGETEPAYVGGLGPAGTDSIRAFVRAGGTLICLEDSSEFAIEAFGLPIKNVLKDLKTSEFYAPGSVLRGVVEPEVSKGGPGRFPLAGVTWGMPQEFSLYFDRSMAFEVQSGPKSDEFPTAPLVKYAGLDTLESGWLLGAEKLQSRAAVVVSRVDRGRVILFGFPPQHRGQPHGTFRLLFNAIETSTR